MTLIRVPEGRSGPVTRQLRVVDADAALAVDDRLGEHVDAADQPHGTIVEEAAASLGTVERPKSAGRPATRTSARTAKIDELGLPAEVDDQRQEPVRIAAMPNQTKMLPGARISRTSRTSADDRTSSRRRAP